MKPEVVIDDAAKLVIAVGVGVAVTVLVTELPPLVAVTINTYDVPVNEVNVAVPTPDDEGVVGVPLTV